MTMSGNENDNDNDNVRPGPSLLQCLGLHPAGVDSLRGGDRSVPGGRGVETSQSGEAGSSPPAQPVTRIFRNHLHIRTSPPPTPTIPFSILRSYQYRYWSWSHVGGSGGVFLDYVLQQICLCVQNLIV